MTAYASASAELAPLDERVADFVDRAVDIARQKQREDLVAQLLDESRRRDDASVTVVVAGEAKRGKSSLVNALLAADVSPVDAAPATNVHIVVQHASATNVRVFHDRTPFGETVAPGALPAWVTAVGNPGNAKRVRSVEVGLDHPLLGHGIVLVDTPGVGGLEAAHADVTLAALATADVLLFVLDASAPISSQELSFLGRVTERIGNVLFALTKIDLYPGADEIIDENQRLLGATRFASAPVFTVSSTRKRKADELDTTDRELADQLRAMSGFTELEQALLAHTVGRTRILRLANLLQLGRIVLDRLDESERALIEGAKGNSHHREELELAQRRVGELEDARRIGSSVVADEFVTLQDALATDFDRAVLDLERRYQVLVGSRATTLDILPERLDAELNALVATLNASIADGVSSVVLALAAALALEGIGTIDAEPAAVGELTVVHVPILVSRPAVDRLLDTTRDVGVMHVPQRLLGGLTAVAFGSAVGAIVGVVAGLAFVGVTLVKSGRVRSQQQGQLLLAEAIQTARREIPPVLRARMRELRREVDASVSQAIRRREGELAAAIREHEQMASEDAATRERAVDAATSRRATLDRLRKQAEELLAALAAARPNTVT